MVSHCGRLGLYGTELFGVSLRDTLRDSSEPVRVELLGDVQAGKIEIPSIYRLRLALLRVRLSLIKSIPNNRG